MTISAFLEGLKNRPSTLKITVILISSEQIASFIRREKAYTRIMPETGDKRSFLFNSPFIHGSMMFRREVFDKERYRTLGKNRKYEDYDLFMRLCADGFKSANLPEKLYRFHYDRSTRRVSFSMRCDEFKVRTEGFKRLGLMPVGFLYALKPILLGFIPRKAMIKLKEKTTGV